MFKSALQKNKIYFLFLNKRYLICLKQIYFDWLKGDEALCVRLLNESLELNEFESKLTSKYKINNYYLLKFFLLFFEH